MLHFSDTVHHLAVFTALKSFGQKTLKHETKQALIFFSPLFSLDSSVLAPYSKRERMNDTREQFTDPNISVKTVGMLGRVLLAHEAAA